jgi:SSS family solute:Na+ symporter
VPLTFALLIAYSVVLVGIGLWIGRRVRGSGDFFVAGRGLSPALLFSTVLASNIGAGTTVNAAAIGYQHGLSAWWWDGSAGLGTLLLAFWIGPRIWREAKEHGDLTVGDFLERHYGGGMRGLVGILIWCGTWSVLSAQLMGIAAVLEAVAGIPRHVGASAGAAIAVTYFIGGGLLSSASVNRVQLLVILAGFAVATPLAVGAVGGWPAVAAMPPSSRLDVFGGQTHPGWQYVFMLAPAFIVSPGLLQKTYGARDTTAVRWGLGWAGMLMLVFACGPPLLGMAAAVQYPGLALEGRPDLALPTVLSGALPPAIGGLALAAVFSAEVSTADAVLFMLSTSASRDLYRGFVNPNASDAALLRVARLAAVVGAICGLALALRFRSILDALSVFYSLLTVVLFVPVIAGLYARNTTRAEGLASVLAGVPILAAVHGLTAGAGYGVVTPTLAGVLAGAGAFGIVRALRRPTDP